MTRLEKLQTLCNDRGISINRLEQEIGVSQGSLRKIDTNMPKADKVFALSQYFHVPMEYFFSDDSPKEKPLYRASCGEGAYPIILYTLLYSFILFSLKFQDVEASRKL